ncbi:hypothetical protein ACJX0J_037373, partial [Zea mays]
MSYMLALVGRVGDGDMNLIQKLKTLERMKKIILNSNVFVKKINIQAVSEYMCLLAYLLASTYTLIIENFFSLSILHQLFQLIGAKENRKIKVNDGIAYIGASTFGTPERAI